jgi:hypothetical protein
MDVRKALAAAGLVVALTGSLTACGGGSDSTGGGGSGGAPTDASKDAFCGTLKDQSSDAAPKDVAARMKSVGTPSDINAPARRGFEVLVDKMSQLSSSNPSDADIAKMAKDFAKQDLADVQAFIAYYVQKCAGGLMPSAGAS